MPSSLEPRINKDSKSDNIQEDCSRKQQKAPLHLQLQHELSHIIKKYKIIKYWKIANVHQHYRQTGCPNKVGRWLSSGSPIGSPITRSAALYIKLISPEIFMMKKQRWWWQWLVRWWYWWFRWWRSKIYLFVILHCIYATVEKVQGVIYLPFWLTLPSLCRLSSEDFHSVQKRSE